jgi:UDP-N-acetylglucosamine 2-epimerase (non-hydrolysing)
MTVRLKTIDLIVGARPNFMKIAPIVNALADAEARGGHLRYRLIHTGQHYDDSMSRSFLGQLGIPDPHLNLQVGSGTQAEQTARVMIAYEQVLLQEKSNLCLVVGDVTSAMACAIAAKKVGVSVAHVEGGLRSGDWSMPEEVNRVVIDAVADWFFTTTETANENLRQYGVNDDRIFFVGNTMIDTLLKHIDHLRPPACWDELKLEPGRYCVLTLHRPANVDSERKLRRLLNAIVAHTRGTRVVFPVHPRTAKSLSSTGDAVSGLTYVEPLGYLEFNFLVKHAKGVITDSGGVAEETTVMGVPCVTLRSNTERPETVTIGTNEILGDDPAILGPTLDRLLAGKWKAGAIPPKWDGRAAQRIVVELERLLI